MREIARKVEEKKTGVIFPESANTLFWVLIIIISVFGMYVLSLLIFFEFQLYTPDAVSFWTVGRGMSNGLVLYEDLFESKPPGIFIISALSFYLTESPILTHLFNGLSFFLLAFVPTHYSFSFWKPKNKKEYSKKDYTLLSLLSFLFGVVLSLYTSFTSGRIFVQPLAIVFVCLFILTLINGEKFNMKPNQKRLFLSFFILSAVGISEPFLLVIITIFLIFENKIKSFRALLKTFFFSALLGLLALFLLGIIKPFFLYYLPYMFFYRIQSGNSFFLRGIDSSRIIGNIINFNPILLLLILFFFIYYCFFQIKSLVDKGENLLLSLCKIVGIIFLINLSVGIGVLFYPHHFSTPIPIYLALFLFFLQKHSLTSIKSRVILFIIILACLTIILDFVFMDRYFDLYKEQLLSQQKRELEVSTHARFVDEVLDKIGSERYLYFGRNDAGKFPKIFGFTKHSPYGPLFNYEFPNQARLPDFSSTNYYFLEKFNWMEKVSQTSFQKNLEETNLILFDIVNDSSLNYGITFNETLGRDFSEVPWGIIDNASIPKNKDYLIYYRKNISNET